MFHMFNDFRVEDGSLLICSPCGLVDVCRLVAVRTSNPSFVLYRNMFGGLKYGEVSLGDEVCRTGIN
jgi:hypothetical protein